MSLERLPVVLLLLALPLHYSGASETIIADFESDSYAPWIATGEAFGSGPAQGTLPNQMQVDGFKGAGLINSFYGGDDSVGRLTSPSFAITHPYLNFLIGGGGYPGETCVNLIIDERVVRTATGPNVSQGGSESLYWISWDLTGFADQQAAIEIVDSRRGSWGHISADHFVLSDEPRSTGPVDREIEVTGRYLHFPVRTGGSKVWVNLMVDEERVRRFEIELADGEFDFVAAADVQPWVGRTMRIVLDPPSNDDEILDQIVSSDTLPGAAEIYGEETRPAFHFTSKIGWLNDPNGLVYQDGIWHLFYQHNPFGWNWGNMHWGHATSADLIHWTEQGDEIHPWSDTVGAAFSGSGLVDHHNTSSLGDGGGDLLVFPLTDTGAGEVLAYSNDHGGTLEVLPEPIVRHQGRDPKVIWHEETERWVMAVYDEADQHQWVAFYTSPNLREWTFASRIEGFYECPDLFQINVLYSDQSCWVLYAADGRYMLGDFDGTTFLPRHEGKHQLWFGDFYAAQTYSNAPQGRRVQMGWGRNISFPGQRFNQQMVMPVELTVRETDEGPRMFAWPVRELDAYTTPVAELSERRLSDDPLRIALLAAPLEIELVVMLDSHAKFNLDVGDVRVSATGDEVSVADVRAPLPAGEGPLHLRVLVDRGSVEVFVNHGAVAFSKAGQYGRSDVPVTVSVEGAGGRLQRAIVREIEVDRIQRPIAE